MNGRLIKSVVAPGKGIKVDYKVSTYTCSHTHFLRFCVSCSSTVGRIPRCIFSRRSAFSPVFCRPHQTSRPRSRSRTLRPRLVGLRWPLPKAHRPTHHQLSQRGLHRPSPRQSRQSRSLPFKVLINLYNLFIQSTHRFQPSPILLLSLDLLCLSSLDGSESFPRLSTHRQLLSEHLVQ